MKLIRLLSILVLMGLLFSVPPTSYATPFSPSRLYSADKNSNDGAASLTVTLAHAPINGHTLIAVIGTVTGGGATVTIPSVTQTGVAWSLIKSSVSTGTGKPGTEIWRGVVGAGASTSVVIANPAGCLGITADVCEYDAALSLDKTAKSDSQYSATLVTGTTAATTYSIEVLVGGIVSWQYSTTTPTNGFTLQDGASNANNCIVSYLDKIVSSSSTYSSGVTAYSVAAASGCIVTLYISSPPTAYYYTLSSIKEDGTAYTPILVTATEAGGVSNFNVTSTPTNYYFTSAVVAFTWSVGGGLQRQIYPVVNQTYRITYPELAASLFNIQFKDLANVFGYGTATLRITRYVGGVLTTIQLTPVPDTIVSNPTPLVPNDPYIVDLIDAKGVTHALGNYIPLASVTTPMFLLASTPFGNLVQFVSVWLKYSSVRVAPYTTSTVTYLNTLTTSTTPWANCTWRLTQYGPVQHSLASSGENIVFTWAGATANRDYIVTLRVYNTFFGNVSKVFMASGAPYVPGAPLDLVGLGNWGGVASTSIIGIFGILVVAGLGTGYKAGSAAVMVVLVSALIAYEGWIAISYTILVIGLAFAVMMAINEGRG